MYSHDREKTDLAFCTSYEDKTSTDIKCTKLSERSEKEAAFGFATLAAEPSFSGSASASVMF